MLCSSKNGPKRDFDELKFRPNFSAPDSRETKFPLMASKRRKTKGAEFRETALPTIPFVSIVAFLEKTWEKKLERKQKNFCFRSSDQKINWQRTDFFFRWTTEAGCGCVQPRLYDLKVMGWKAPEEPMGSIVVRKRGSIQPLSWSFSEWLANFFSILSEVFYLKKNYQLLASNLLFLLHSFTPPTCKKIDATNDYPKNWILVEDCPSIAQYKG